MPEQLWLSSWLYSEFGWFLWWLRVLSVWLQCGRPGFSPRVGKIPWRRKWQPIPVLLPGKFQEWGSLVGYSSWGCKELDTTEQLHFLSIVPFGEENGNSLQCSWPETPSLPHRLLVHPKSLRSKAGQQEDEGRNCSLAWPVSCLSWFEVFIPEWPARASGAA